MKAIPAVPSHHHDGVAALVALKGCMPACRWTWRPGSSQRTRGCRNGVRAGVGTAGQQQVAGLLWLHLEDSRRPSWPQPKHLQTPEWCKGLAGRYSTARKRGPSGGFGLHRAAAGLHGPAPPAEGPLTCRLCLQPIYRLTWGWLRFWAPEGASERGCRLAAWGLTASAVFCLRAAALSAPLFVLWDVCLS